MNTDAFIRALASDAAAVPASPDRLWRWAAAGAVALAATVFLAGLGPRADLAAAFATLRFPFKLTLAGLAALSAFALVRRMGRPGARIGGPLRALAAVALLLAAGIVAELAATDPATWAARAVGGNALVCLVAIPVIAAGPLSLAVAVLRRGAPTRPTLAGAAAGLAAGALAATFYAVHCTDDSPLFVALWYGLAVTITAAAGGLLGRRILRW